ncbi:MAG: hypothetical protein QOD26_3765 [Betaproteobacteria bacterium]|jgi:hypothetical protein|nr:hypothetical protein [Betaproteobacteria bacterium]
MLHGAGGQRQLGIHTAYYSARGPFSLMIILQRVRTLSLLNPCAA